MFVMDRNVTAREMIDTILTLENLIQTINSNSSKPEVVCVTVQCVHEEPSPLAL